MPPSDTHTPSRTFVLQYESSMYIGIIASFIIYGEAVARKCNPILRLVIVSGIYIGLYFLSIHALCVKPGITRLRRTLLVLFSSILLLSYTAFFLSAPLLGQEVWIEHRDMSFAEYLMYVATEDTTAVYMVVANAVQNLAMLLDNALLVGLAVFIVTNLKLHYCVFFKRYTDALLFLVQGHWLLFSQFC
jgi:hypothetical protein